MNHNFSIKLGALPKNKPVINLKAMRNTPSTLNRTRSLSSNRGADSYAPTAPAARLSSSPTSLAASSTFSAAHCTKNTPPKKSFVAGLRTGLMAVGEAAKKLYHCVIDFFSPLGAVIAQGFAVLGKKISYNAGLLYAKLTGRERSYKFRKALESVTSDILKESSLAVDDLVYLKAKVSRMLSRARRNLAAVQKKTSRR